MRCNSSMILRWIPFLCTFLIIFTSISTVNSGPTNRRHARMIRDTYSNESSNNVTNNLPDTCLREGAVVSKSSVVCEKRAGCRAIQKTGECCPEYQCECEKNGKVYGNGEKLIEPDTPCRVCYCQGGEILCSRVTCYKRNDCEPKYIQGRCCPEYDNCPTLEQVLASQSLTSTTTTTTTTTTTESSNDVILNDGASVNQNTNETAPNGSDNPLGIKIKEITKPEEIRITNEKPKKNVMKPSALAPSTTSTETTSGPISTSSLDELRGETFSTEGPTPVSNGGIISSTAETTEGPATIDFSTATNYVSPSVVHLGDKVLILDHNRPTILEIEGLQQGGGDTMDFVEGLGKNLSTPISNEESDNNSIVVLEHDELGGDSDFNGTGSDNFLDLYNKMLISLTNSSEALDYIEDLAIQNVTSSPLNRTSEYDMLDDDTNDDHVASSSDNIQVLSPINETSTELESSYSSSNSNSTETNLVTSSNSNISSYISSTIATPPEGDDTANRKTYVEDDELPNHELINPGHAAIPEDFTIFGRDQDLVALDADNQDMENKESHHNMIGGSKKILGEVLSLRANGSLGIMGNESSSQTLDWLKLESTTATDYEGSSPPSLNDSNESSGCGSEGSGNDCDSGISGMPMPSIILNDKLLALPTKNYEHLEESSGSTIITDKSHELMY